MKVLLRRAEVEERFSLSRSTIYAMMSAGLFPRPINIGRRSVRWRLSDLEAWLEQVPTRLWGALSHTLLKGSSNDVFGNSKHCLAAC